MLTSAVRPHLHRRLGSLKTERSSFIDHWRDLSDYVLPRAARFLVTDRNKGDRRNSRIIDPTATMSARTLSSGMMGGVTSPSRPWFQLRTPDPELNKFQPVKVYLEEVRMRMSEAFLASNLYTTLPITYSDLGVFGTHCFAVLEDDEDVIRCHAFPIGSYMLGASHRGSIDTVYREYQMTVSQLVGKFGKDNVSDNVRSAYERGHHDQWIDVVHAVEPNELADYVKFESKFKPWRSVYWEPGAPGDQVLSERGFDSFPCMAPRWALTGEDIYGSSPAMDVLGQIKALQVECKRKTQLIDKGNNPPLQAPAALKNQMVSMLPGGVTFSDVSTGQQGITPIYKPDPQWLAALTEDIRELQLSIKRGFFEDLFLMIANDDRSNVTAREIVEKHEEKLLMLGPVLERLNDDVLDPLIDRTFEIMNRRGMLPEPPPELQGMDLSVEYVSVMAQAQKLASLSSIERLTQFTVNLAGAYPEALDKYDPDAAIEEMGTVLGVAPRIVRDQKDVDKIRTARQQQVQQQQALAAAESAAKTAKTLGDTNTTDPSALTNIQQAFQGVPVPVPAGGI